MFPYLNPLNQSPCKVLNFIPNTDLNGESYVTLKLEPLNFTTITSGLLDYLRLFTLEGVEIYEVQLRYLQNATFLIACNKKTGVSSKQILSLFHISSHKSLFIGFELNFARHKITKETRTIYKLVIRQSNTQHMKEVLQRSETLKSVQNPHIQQIFNVLFDTNQQYLYYICESQPGVNLAEYIQVTEGLDESKIKKMFLQICVALIYMHNKGISHRQLTAPNIDLIHNHQDIFLTNLASSTCSGNYTDYYRAPETFDQASSSPDYLKLDCWNLGIILYFMVCGRYPFETEQQILHECPNFPSNRTISGQLKHLINSLLEKVPNIRMSVTSAVRHPWLREQQPNYVHAQIEERKHTQFQERISLLLTPKQISRRIDTILENEISSALLNFSNDSPIDAKSASPRERVKTFQDNRSPEIKSPSSNYQWRNGPFKSPEIFGTSSSQDRLPEVRKPCFEKFQLNRRNSPQFRKIIQTVRVTKIQKIKGDKFQLIFKQ